MVLVCALIALVAARKPIAHAVGSLLHRNQERATAGPTFPLSIDVPQPRLYRFDLVPVEVTYVKADGSPISHAAPEVVVRDASGDILETVGEVKTVPLRFDRQKGVWKGTWPVPLGAEAGTNAFYHFEAQATVNSAEWRWETPKAQADREKANRRRPGSKPEPEPKGEATCVASGRFRILRAAKPDLRAGTCAVTWEPDFPQSSNLVRPDGTEGDWRAMFDWAEFMGADAFWFRAGVTEAYSPAAGLSHERPWNQVNIDNVPELAVEAHRRGLKFGTWAVAFETYPNRRQDHARARDWKPDYRWTENYSRSGGAPYETAAISLLDKRRPGQIARFFAQMQAIDDVDCVGLDYVRSGADWGGYELVEPFAEEMPVVGLPAEWDAMSRTARMGWVCNMLEGTDARGVYNWQRNIDLYHQWNWWRAHRVSLMLRSITRQAKLTKPLWTFTLSWWHGEQHGQDPLMFVDAGVSIDAVMLYECDSVAQYESLLEQWHDGLAGQTGIPAGHIYIMAGDQVSFGSHQRLTSPAAPEELYRRITKAAVNMTDGGPLQGAFVHDVSRICLPTLRANRGPYPGREWAIAGAAAFSKVRSLWGVQPIRCQLEAPDKAAVGATATCQLLVRNTCPVAVKNIEVEVLDTVGVNPINREHQIASLGPREDITVPIQFQATGWDASRASRYMVAVQVRWPEGEYGEKVRPDVPRLYTVMAYLNAA
jgi:hypothetical protein